MESPIAAIRWEALGTSVHVLVTDEGAAANAAEAVRLVLETVDATYSRFRADSELTALNDSPGRPVRVSPLLFEALQAAVRAAVMTDGAVDPTVGGALRALGYDRDFAALSTAATPAPITIVRVPGWRTIQLDSVGRTARVPHGVSLDLGSTGKALAADLAARAAQQAAGCGVLVSLGGDLATAGPAPDDGWRVNCAEDSRTAPDADGEVIAIHGDALATSSTTVRRWTAGGIVRHHIVDPATGLPVDGPWRTATVVARTCVDANTAATAAIVLGERAIAWLDAAGLPARLVSRAGDVSRVGHWPDPLAGPAADAA